MISRADFLKILSAITGVAATGGPRFEGGAIVAPDPYPPYPLPPVVPGLRFVRYGEEWPVLTVFADTERIELTTNGLFGTEAMAHREFMPGATSYRVVGIADTERERIIPVDSHLVHPNSAMHLIGWQTTLGVGDEIRLPDGEVIRV